MNILVTGAHGQLGNEMRTVAGKSSDKYFFTDVSELDITDADAVMEAVSGRNTAGEKMDVIVNCAAYTNVDKAEDDEDFAGLLNCKAAENLAVAAKAYDAVLIHVSTDYVFGGDGCVPYSENAPTAPSSVYGRTKLAGEKAIELSGCRYIIFRTAWLYSPYGKNFVKTMRQLTAERDALNVVFDQVGSPTCAADLAGLIFKIIETRMLDRQGIYHYSNEGVCSWYDFAVEICRMSGNSCNIRPCHSDEFPCKAHRPHYSVLDKTKVKKTFGIEIPYWKDSLSHCIEILKNNEL